MSRAVLTINTPSAGARISAVRLPSTHHLHTPSLVGAAKPLKVGADKPAFAAPAASRTQEASEAEPAVLLEIAPSTATSWEETSVQQTQQPSQHHEEGASGIAQEADASPCVASSSLACEASEYAVPSSAASCVHSTSWNQKDQNSVTIKSDTSVKQAAGAIVKVLDRLCSTIVTALQHDPSGAAAAVFGSPCGPNQQFEALNRTVKALAVCRKYLTDSEPGAELSFLPVHRSDRYGREDPYRFSFLAFKSSMRPGVQLQAGGEADLHVSSASDPQALGATIVQTIIQQGQAVMKAGGGSALFVAMSAVIRARHMLKAFHAMDIMLVPQWITEDTRAVLGRESKFLQFNLLPAGLHGVMPGVTGAAHAPAIIPYTTATTAAAVAPAPDTATAAAQEQQLPEPVAA